MTETPDLPSTPEQPRPADQEAEFELVPAAVLQQQGEAASAPETTTPLPAEPAGAPAGPGWSLQEPPASLAPPSVAAPASAPVPALAAPAPAPAPLPTPAPVFEPAAAAEPEPAPSWAAPAAGGLPPYGEGPAPIGFEPAPAKSSRNRTILTAAIVAALVGGGVGAGISYAVRGNSGNDVTSSTAINSSGLDTSSANATAVTAVSKKVLPSVVTITVAPTASNSSSSSSTATSGDIGTGIILSSTGEILTNNHVISLAASGGYTITVTFDGGANAQATIVDRDATSDLAVIQASNVSGLTPATLGSSTGVQVGQQVVAIGAPLGMSNTVTSGIVSALNRPVIPASDSGTTTTTPSTSTTALDAIQTDAAINPGNSGGPLVDMNGDVVGINAAIASTGSGTTSSTQSGSIGLGFAIPISQAEPVIKQLEAKQTPTHSVLGVSVQDAATTATHTGATLESVTAGGAAAQAGLKVGDEVIKMDDQEIDGSDAMEAAVHSYRPGTTVTITYIRNGQTATTTATLASATDTSTG